MSVVEATERDVARLPSALRDSALAASALALAAELDSAGNSATSKSMCAKALLETLDRLRELTPPQEENDQLDQLAERRARRLARGSGAKA